MLQLRITQQALTMNSYEKAVFLEFALNNLQNTNGNSKIAGGQILKFGYHTNHPITFVGNDNLAHDLSANEDGGVSAQKKALHFVDTTLKGQLSANNPGLFEIYVDDEGCAYGVREKSISNMTHPQPHVFELYCYAPKDDVISTTKGERLQIVFHKKDGSVWTLNDMIALSSVIKPIGLTI